MGLLKGKALQSTDNLVPNALGFVLLFQIYEVNPRRVYWVNARIKDKAEIQI